MIIIRYTHVQNEELLIVEAGGTCAYHEALVLITFFYDFVPHSCEKSSIYYLMIILMRAYGNASDFNVSIN